jgi:hypothetical protein
MYSVPAHQRRFIQQHAKGDKYHCVIETLNFRETGIQASASSTLPPALTASNNLWQVTTVFSTLWTWAGNCNVQVSTRELGDCWDSGERVR